MQKFITLENRKYKVTGVTGEITPKATAYFKYKGDWLPVKNYQIRIDLAKKINK